MFPKDTDIAAAVASAAAIAALSPAPAFEIQGVVDQDWVQKVKVRARGAHPAHTTCPTWLLVVISQRRML
jgi:mannose/cellobiose epimerase-like protein (N-acyl-D-glucosamine 2-epimerase family)